MIYNIYAVGDSLRNIRKKYGYTQNNMAESLGIPKGKGGEFFPDELCCRWRGVIFSTEGYGQVIFGIEQIEVHHMPFFLWGKDTEKGKRLYRTNVFVFPVGLLTPSIYTNIGLFPFVAKCR